jgi:hydroxyacylglutathione hydrolase
MLLKRFYDTRLAQASYLLGCQRTGDAIVVDPNRDIEQYIAAAAEEELRITHVTESHIHADFVSGSRELAERTGAKLFLSDEGGPHWKYAFAESADAQLLKDGDVIMVGNVRLDVMHTPGHTPEHIVFLVTDTASTEYPMGALTGDFIFVGDVGRPDLLERAAHVVGSMESSARALYASIASFKRQPDYLQLWPGHGAGSACGKSLGAVPSTTLGYERIASWALADIGEQEFVDAVLAGQPEPPKYFADMKRINRDGPAILGGFRRPPQEPSDALRAVLDAGAFVVDTRPAAEYAKGFVRGTINIPFNRSFSNWAGSLIPFDRDFHLIAGSASVVDQMIRDLAMIGLDRVVGYFDSSAIAGPLASIEQTTVQDLSTQIVAGAVHVIDVRGRAEWNAGHLAGAQNIPLGELPDRLAELPTGAPLVLHCQGGGRSSIAASVLKAHGIDAVANLTGGFGEWTKQGLPVADD